MVLDGMLKWFMGGKEAGPIKLELQFIEYWNWLGVEPPDMI
jgi:hypothetical protein